MPRKAHQMVGHVFGSLMVVDEASGSKPKNKKFNVVCIHCGAQKEMGGGNIRRVVTSGSQGCSCGTRIRRNRLTKKDAWRDPAYGTWEGMIRRCKVKSHPAYHRYGGRGISVCDEWSDFEAFRQWIYSNGWVRGESQIDRINNDGGYSPDNCRVTSSLENNNNKSTNRLIAVGGETLTISQAARKFGIGKTTIKERLNRGWSDAESVRPLCA